MPDLKEANLRGGEVAGWTYGNVLTRVYQNQNRNGRMYYTVIQDRLFGRKVGGTGTAKSFYCGDVKNMLHGLVRARIWLNKKKREETLGLF